MNNECLYAFFCAEQHLKNSEEIVVNITNDLKSIYYVYSQFGEMVYKNSIHDNPLMGRSNQTFFGASPDGFRSCLLEYLELVEKDINLRVNILSIGEGVSNKELYVFMHILAICMWDSNWDSRLKVFVSKEILEVYSRESGRLLELDTDPDDYVQF